MLFKTRRKETMPLPIRSPLVSSAMLLALLTSAGTAAAQAQAAPDPAPLLQLQYTSVIQDYRSYADAPVQSWRDANDRASSIGGWRAYAKEIQGAAPAKDAPATPSSDPHAGHQMGGTKP